MNRFPGHLFEPTVQLKLWTIDPPHSAWGAFIRVYFGFQWVSLVLAPWVESACVTLADGARALRLATV